MSAGFSAVVPWSFGRKQIPSCKSHQSTQQSPENKQQQSHDRKWSCESGPLPVMPVSNETVIH